MQVIEPGRMCCERTAQLHAPLHRRILVGVFDQSAGRGLADCQWTVFVGKALTEIDRAMFGRQCRHHREDCRRQTRKDGIEAVLVARHRQSNFLEGRAQHRKRGFALTTTVQKLSAL